MIYTDIASPINIKNASYQIIKSGIPYPYFKTNGIIIALLISVGDVATKKFFFLKT